MTVSSKIRQLVWFSVFCLFSFMSMAGEPGPAPGLTLERVHHKNVPYVVARVDVRKAGLGLYWKDGEGKPYTNFYNLRDSLARQGKKLVFATNSGIYARDYTPLGLHVEGGRELEPLNRKRGGGNFFIKPNGVFFITGDMAGIMTTDAYAEKNIAPSLAVQSGPMLLMDGGYSPRLLPDSDTYFIRNGVGLVSDHEIVFVLSELPVNFYTFAAFFKGELGCSGALYLDGSLSGMYAPAIGREDIGGVYVGMLGITVEQQEPAEKPDK